MSVVNGIHVFLLQAPEKNEHCSQLSKIITTEQNSEVVKSPEKQIKNHNIRDTEVSALNMAIDTLRWQLAQVRIIYIGQMILSLRYIGAPI